MTNTKKQTAFDALKAENKKLRKAIKNQAIELERNSRELEIEGALERLRAKSLAMKKSEELAGLSSELVKQVEALGVDTWFCAFNFYDDDEKGSLEWGSNSQTTFPEYRTPRENIFLEYYQAGKRGETLLIHEIGEEACPAHYEYLCSLPGVGEQLLKMKEAGLSFPSSQIDHVAFHKYGYVLFITFEPVPESHDIFKRFAKVFEQTYTRFLDLQKAETQAREAQIEVALERVRARSMAMHESEDLKEVIQVLYNQFVQLDLFVEHAGFIIDFKSRDDMLIWLADKNAVFPQLSIPYFDSPHWNSFIEAKEKGSQFFVNLLDFEAKNKFYNQLFTHIPDLTDEVKEHYLKCEGLAISTVLMDNVGLYIENFSGIPYSKEDNDILIRFGKVFQQTYTRFLDLQKAEAQAREAEIELGLERVRARAMAMQQSDELSDLVDTVFKELTKLDFALAWCIINIIDEPTLSNTVWAANPKIDAAPDSYYMKFEDYPFHDAMLKGYRERRLESIYTLEGQEKKIYDEYLFNETEFRRVPAEAQEASRAMERYVVTWTFSNFGGLQTVGDVPLSSESMDILKRFGRVFDLTYTRFNDLQKAEEQAREIKLVNEENERLLHSILPEQIAHQIRTGQRNIVKRFEQASILFADIVGFTVLSEKAKPSEVVNILNGLFSKFDDLTDQYHLEKIKTIGDAYMVASGVPEEKEDHAHALFQFAQDLLEITEIYNQQNNQQLKLRIGISSGPVVAGVIGKKKFAYDLWGDSVNTAARMEAYGQSGKIQVAPSSYELLKNDFSFDIISGVNIKGKGIMDVYLWKPNP